jgi:starch synthase
MEIIHVTAECYPVAKAGGLGDVLGALPKYQVDMGNIAKVVMPMYRTKFLYNNQWEVVHKGASNLGSRWFDYTIIREQTGKLGFELYLVDINGLLDREKVYGYNDDTERFMSFQIAVVDWISKWEHRPDVVHVHDHHTALIPFMMQHCFAFRTLSGIPSVLTIHNGQYQGQFDWSKSNYIPAWDSWKAGMLEWNGSINPLAAGVKCAWKVTTVSPSYMDELRYMSNGLEDLFEYEKGKCTGILNGIDVNVWDPAKDTYLTNHYDALTVDEGKRTNKKELCNTFQLDIDKPLFVFIGRLVGEKAADLLPQAIGDSLYYIGRKMNYLILGSGDPQMEGQLDVMKNISWGDYNVYIGYNEQLSHLMYAGADFLLMPSRVEPCGLNQLYSMRYGTVPVVRKTGGLKDTVIDYGEPGGYGVTFNHAAVGDITEAIYRGVQLYNNTEKFNEVRKTMMDLDFSWTRSAKEYTDLYKSLK